MFTIKEKNLGITVYEVTSKAIDRVVLKTTDKAEAEKYVALAESFRK